MRTRTADAVHFPRLPLRTIGRCLFCGETVLVRVWDGTLLRYRWQRWLSPVRGEEHHCLRRGEHRASPSPFC